MEKNTLIHLEIWGDRRGSNPQLLHSQCSASTNSATTTIVTGAGDGIRTRDILLGRQKLYQLSYTRILYSS